MSKWLGMCTLCSDCVQGSKKGQVNTAPTSHQEDHKGTRNKTGKARCNSQILEKFLPPTCNFQRCGSCKTECHRDEHKTGCSGGVRSGRRQSERTHTGGVLRICAQEDVTSKRRSSFAGRSLIKFSSSK